MGDQLAGPKSAGELAYERYAVAVGGVNYAGEPLKQFHELSDKIKAGWEAAAPAPIELTEPEWEAIRICQAGPRDETCSLENEHLVTIAKMSDLIAKLADALRIKVE